ITKNTVQQHEECMFDTDISDVVNDIPDYHLKDADDSTPQTSIIPTTNKRKKPPNKFVLFLKDFRAILKRIKPCPEPVQCSIGGAVWGLLPEEYRQRWEERAVSVAIEYKYKDSIKSTSS